MYVGVRTLFEWAGGVCTVLFTMRCEGAQGIYYFWVQLLLVSKQGGMTGGRDR